MFRRGALRASALLELAHVRRVDRVPVDHDLGDVRHVPSALVVVDEDADDSYVLKLGKVELDLLIPRRLRRGEDERLGGFFTAVVEREVGLVHEHLDRPRRGPVRGAADDEGREVDELLEGDRDDQLLVVVGLAEQPGVFSVPGLDGVAPFLARRLRRVAVGRMRARAR